MPTPKSASTAATTDSSLTPNQTSLMEDAAKGPVELTNSKLSRTAKSLAKKKLGVIDESVKPPVFTVAEVAPGQSKTSTKKVTTGKMQPHPSVTGDKAKPAKPAKVKPPKADGSLTDKQLTVIKYLLDRKATSATTAVSRNEVWENAGSGAVCSSLRSKKLVDRSTIEGQGLSLYLTDAGVKAAS